MEALVCSDSHGRTELLNRMLKQNPSCRVIFFLGDGEKDMHYALNAWPEHTFYYVSGNCDTGSVLPAAKTTNYKHIEGNTIVFTHGHEYFVKQTLTELMKHTESVMGNIAFYGHTHRQDFHYDSVYKIFVLNPGALCLGSYAKIEINKYGLEAQFKSVFQEDN